MKLREARYAGLHVHVAVRRLQENRVLIVWKKLKFNLVKKHCKHINRFYYTKQMSRLMSGCDPCRLACE